MVVARQSFLRAGYYQPLSERLNELARDTLRPIGAPAEHVIDAG